MDRHSRLKGCLIHPWDPPFKIAPCSPLHNQTLISLPLVGYCTLTTPGAPRRCAI